MDEWIIGGTDKYGRKIVKIYNNYIFDSYVIYSSEDETLGILYHSFANCNYDINPISTYLAEIYSLLEDKQLPKFSLQIALSITQCLQGNNENAIKILKNAKSNIIKERIHSYRSQYIAGASMAVALLSLTTYLSPYIESLLPDTAKLIFSDRVIFDNLTFCSLIGGFISVIKDSSFSKIDIGVSSKPSGMGFTRIVTSYLASIIAFLAVKSNFILGFLGSSPQGLYLVAAAAGFSQSIVIDILKKIELQTSENNTSQQ